MTLLRRCVSAETLPGVMVRPEKSVEKSRATWVSPVLRVPVALKLAAEPCTLMARTGLGRLTVLATWSATTCSIEGPVAAEDCPPRFLYVPVKSDGYEKWPSYV